MQTFVSKVMSLPFNTLSSFVLAFLPRSKRLLNRPLFPLLPIYLPWSDGTGCRELSFWVLSFKPAFSLSSSTFLKGSLVPLHFLPWGWCHLHIWDSWSSRQSWFQLVIHLPWHLSWCNLHVSQISRWQYAALMYSFPNFEPVCCFMSGSNCCFLTCIQVSQEAGQVVWYFHLFNNFSVSWDSHSQRL